MRDSKTALFDVIASAAINGGCSQRHKESVPAQKRVGGRVIVPTNADNMLSDERNDDSERIEQNGIEIYSLPSVEDTDDDDEHEQHEIDYEAWNHDLSTRAEGSIVMAVPDRRIKTGCEFIAPHSVEAVLSTRKPGTERIMYFAPSKCACSHCELADRLEEYSPRTCMSLMYK